MKHSHIEQNIRVISRESKPLNRIERTNEKMEKILLQKQQYTIIKVASVNCAKIGDWSGEASKLILRN